MWALVSVPGVKSPEEGRSGGEASGEGNYKKGISRLVTLLEHQHSSSRATSATPSSPALSARHSRTIPLTCAEPTMPTTRRTPCAVSSTCVCVCHPKQLLFEGVRAVMHVHANWEGVSQRISCHYRLSTQCKLVRSDLSPVPLGDSPLGTLN